MPLPAPLSPVLAAVLAALTLGMAAVFVGAAWRPPGRQESGRWALAALVVALVYLCLSGGLAATGALADIDARPPAVGLLLVVLTVGTIGLAFSRLGDRLLAWPLAALVGVQAFRIGVEAWLGSAYLARAVPVEMTYFGTNVDVATGLLALLLGAWLWRGSPPRWTVWAWNVLGLGLLLVVMATAAASAYGIVQTDPRLLLPTQFPGVWLPAWLVQLALLGHLLVFRKLRARR